MPQIDPINVSEPMGTIIIDGESLAQAIEERELRENAPPRRGQAQEIAPTRIEIDILAAQVRQNEILIGEVKNLTRQLHEFLKATNFQYAKMVEP